jgi:hypothetical protein
MGTSHRGGRERPAASRQSCSGGSLGCTRSCGRRGRGLGRQSLRLLPWGSGSGSCTSGGGRGRHSRGGTGHRRYSCDTGTGTADRDWHWYWLGCQETRGGSGRSGFTLRSHKNSRLGGGRGSSGLLLRNRRNSNGLGGWCCGSHSRQGSTGLFARPVRRWGGRGRGRGGGRHRGCSCKALAAGTHCGDSGCCCCAGALARSMWRCDYCRRRHTTAAAGAAPARRRSSVAPARRH